MKVAADLRFKTYLLISMLIFFGPIGDLLMSKGMRRIGTAPSWDPAALLHYAFQVFTSPIIWCGTLAMIGFFISYTVVLTWADYSYVQPASALTSGIAALLGRFVLGETVTPLRWAGIAIVCLGVLIIGYTPPRTTEPIDAGLFRAARNAGASERQLRDSDYFAELCRRSRRRPVVSWGSRHAQAVDRSAAGVRGRGSRLPRQRLIAA
jgi:multidrug transporter EmrE-like cation transporter